MSFRDHTRTGLVPPVYLDPAVRDIQPPQPTRLGVQDGILTLGGFPLSVEYGRRGVQVGCTYITYEALDKIYKDSQ